MKRALESVALQLREVDGVAVVQTRVSATIGICTAEQPPDSSDLFAAADRALFAGKAGGRNTIEVVPL